MRIDVCPDKGGTAVTTDFIHDTVQQVAAHCKANTSRSGRGGEWEGRTFEGGWDEVAKAFAEPWKEGIEKVDKMMEEILASDLEPPKSVRRKNRWDETDGEIDVDRVMVGEPEYMRRAFRSPQNGPRNVAIMCNTGNTGGFTADQIFWRGAAAIAAVDMLEEAGYQCEVWVWNHAMGCFGGSSYGGNRKGSYTSSTGGSSFFFSAKLKDCGDPLDRDRLTNALSAWFFRTVIFGMRDVVQSRRFGSGSSYPILGKWADHIDVTEGITKIEMGAPTNREAAIAAAKKVIEDVTGRSPYQGEEQ